MIANTHVISDQRLAGVRYTNAVSSLAVHFAAALVGFCLVAMTTSMCLAQNAPLERFDDKNQYPWIDHESGDLLAPKTDSATEPINDPIDPGNRNSDWVTPPTTTAPTGGGGGSAMFSYLLQVGMLVFLGAIVMVIVVILLWSFLLGRGTQNIKQSATPTVDVGLTARLEALPEPLRRDESDLLAAARRYYDQGEYSEAIVYLFSYQLVELDRKQVIRLTRGKTNRQYLRESQTRPNLASILAGTIETFEDAFFGRYEIDRPRIDRCWQDLKRFESELQSA